MPTQLRSADNEYEAAEQLHADGLTDGLPVVVPTPERVERMVLAGGLDPDAVLGEVGPAQGVATVEKVAIQAVMAGCLPDHFPVVLAAVQAVIDPRFALDQVQGTTHSLGPCVVVNGPARELCGPYASGTGALGPGPRANAATGRALRLVLMNLGGGRPGVSDMALLGHPGKFTYCLAEAEERSPFPPLHTTLGFDEDDSTVTVIGAEGPHSVISFVDPTDARYPEHLLRVLAASLCGLGTNNTYVQRGAMVVILNPEHAQVLAAAGYDRSAIQCELFERAHNPRGLLHELAGFLVPDGDPEELLHPVQCPQDLLVLVAGGGGQYSAVLPTWGGNPQGQVPVTKRVRVDDLCEIELSAPTAIDGQGDDDG